jgi:hypothetical protein
MTTWLVLWDLAAWAGQGMVQTGHTHTSVSLAQGCRSGRRLCGKTGLGDTPSHLNVCYFNDFFNKYLLRKKNMEHYFLGSLVAVWRGWEIFTKFWSESLRGEDYVGGFGLDRGIFYLHHNVHTSSGAHLLSHTVDTVVLPQLCKLWGSSLYSFPSASCRFIPLDLNVIVIALLPARA